jgi:hypothetical protein
MMAGWPHCGSPPRFSTVRIRWLEKCPVLLGFSHVAVRWRRGRDSPTLNYYLPIFPRKLRLRRVMGYIQNYIADYFLALVHRIMMTTIVAARNVPTHYPHPMVKAISPTSPDRAAGDRRKDYGVAACSPSVSQRRTASAPPPGRWSRS